MEHLLEHVRSLESEIFGDQLDPDDTSRMRNAGAYSWLYRPSHHIRTGLVTEQDIRELRNGKRLLSIGAHPAYLERVLLEIGVPAGAMTIADVLPEISACEGGMEKCVFDCTESWPELGLFDLIIFPESLCIAMRDRIKREGRTNSDEPFATDTREAELLTHILKESLSRLHSGGEVRANGPMSHPKVANRASTAVKESGFPHSLQYQRFFLRVRRA